MGIFREDVCILNFSNIFPTSHLSSVVLFGWLPAIMLFSGMIYSGSVALSKLVSVSQDGS